MGRLIDEDDVRALLVDHHFDEFKGNFDLLIHNLCREVQQIPTAYNVDMVIANLEKQRDVWNDNEVANNFLVSEKRKAYDMAIKIVKGGYVDA